MAEVGDQRVVDRFDGNALDERWLENDGIGTNIFAMVDAIDEGYSIITDTSANANGEISFGNKKQYDSQNFEMESIWRRVAGGEGQGTSGVTDEPFGVLGSSVNNQLNPVDTFGATFKQLVHNNGSSPTSATDLASVIDTIFHRYKIESQTTFAKVFVDGILEVTVTTDLPTGSVQPSFMSRRVVTGGTQEGRIRYASVYNT